MENQTINIEEIPQIQNINKSVLNILDDLKIVSNYLEPEILLNILGILDIFYDGDISEIKLDNKKSSLENKELLEHLSSLNNNLYTVLENILVIIQAVKADFGEIPKVLSLIIKEISIYIFQYKYELTYDQAKNKIEYKDHYENLLKESGLDSLYEELNEYFYNELDKKQLHKENIKAKYEHYFHDDTNIPTNHDNDDSFHIVFQINKNCNFKCTYCYEGLDKVTEILKEKDIEEFVNGIKAFQKDLEKRGEVSKLSFSILGGEPTIVDQKITHKLTKALSDELDLKYIILITNNYSAERTIKFFHPEFPKEKIKIQVSYDGGIIQEDYRKDSKKAGTKESITKEIYKLLGKDYKVTLKATLPIEAIKDVPEAVMDYVSFEEDINKNNHNPGNFSYYPTFDTTSILMYKLRQSILYGDESGKKKLFEDIDKTFRFLLKFELDRFLNGKKAFTRWFREMSYSANNSACSAGMKLFGLDQDGNTRYCHRVEFGEEHSKSKFPYPEEQLKSLNYGNIKNLEFIENFHRTKKIIEKEHVGEKVDNFSYCSSCKTLSCVKCPMISITPDRSMDTNTSMDLYTDMYSHGLTLACEINNYISKYLYIFDKIINK